MEFNRDTKMAKVKEIEDAEKSMAKRIDKLVSNGELEEDAQRQGCGGGGGLRWGVCGGVVLGGGRG